LPLSAEDRERVAARVRWMVADYRAKPTPGKEDGFGVEIAAMSPEEREHVTAVLLELVAEEARR